MVATEPGAEELANMTRRVLEARTMEEKRFALSLLLMRVGVSNARLCEASEIIDELRAEDEAWEDIVDECALRDEADSCRCDGSCAGVTF